MSGACSGILLKTDFVAGQYCKNGQQYASFLALPGATFARASIKTCATSAGLIVQAASSAPCITDQGLLIEESRTNLLLWSQDVSNAAWQRSDLTVDAATPAPDGTVTGQLLTAGSAGTDALVSSAATVTASSTNVFSIFLKKSGTRWLRLVFSDTTGTDGFDQWVDLTNGVLGSAGNRGAGTKTSASIRAYANGYFRVELVGVASTRTSIHVTIASASADGSASRVSGATYYIWGAECNAGTSFATSYILTTSAAATRAADVASITMPTVGGAGTLVVSGLWDHTSTMVEGLAAISDGTGLNQIGAFRTATGAMQGRYVVANADTSPGAVLSAGGSGLRRTAIAWSPTRVIAAAGGTLSTAGTPAATPVTNTLYIGLTSAGASPANGAISSVVLTAPTSSDAQLQALTQ